MKQEEKMYYCKACDLWHNESSKIYARHFIYKSDKTHPQTKPVEVGKTEMIGNNRGAVSSLDSIPLMDKTVGGTLKDKRELIQKELLEIHNKTIDRLYVPLGTFKRLYQKILKQDKDFIKKVKEDVTKLRTLTLFDIERIINKNSGRIDEI